MPHHDKTTLKVSYAILIVMAVTFLIFKLFGIGSAHEPLDVTQAFKDYQQTTISFPTANYKAYLAKTSAQQSQGLSNIASLPLNEGMLFVFDQPGQYKFWMKDMNFNLDFVWIRDGKVVDLTENVSSALFDQHKTFTSKELADSVMEVNAGQVRLFGLGVGDGVVVQ